MSGKEIVDYVFDSLERITGWLYKKDLIKNWFNFLGWTAMTAVAFGFAKSSHSGGIYVISWISAILVFFYGWHSTFEIFANIVSEHKHFSIVVISGLISILVPVLSIFYLISAITDYLSRI